MVIKIIKKYIFVILAVLIAVGGYFYISAVGNEYTWVRPAYGRDFHVTDVYIHEPSEKDGVVEFLGWEDNSSSVTVHMRSVKPGRVFIMVESGEESCIGIFFVHKNGVITCDRFFGDCTGVNVVIGAIIAYLIALGIYFILKFRKSMNL